MKPPIRLVFFRSPGQMFEVTIAGTQNPSITYMALTARAVDYAHTQVTEGHL